MSDNYNCCVCGDITSRRENILGYNIPLCRDCNGEARELVLDKAQERINDIEDDFEGNRRP